MPTDYIRQNKWQCCGCAACSLVCPTDCITMRSDDEGFLYPTIDNQKCVNCNKCENICPVLNNNDSDMSFEDEAYASINKNIDARKSSSSGGIFWLLAENILDQNGIVFGAAFNEKFEVEHTYISNKSDIYKLQGSKYVQSNVGRSYAEAERFLKNGTVVLYTGTPCQIAGLKVYLKKDYENLICQDIICHGVPSPKIWKEYVRYREKKAHSSVRRMSFRHKKYGWKTYSVLLDYSNNTKYVEIMSLDLYMRLFLANLSLRPSCYKCAFKGIKRQADITLADFWGINDINPAMNDNLGTSLVIIHSNRGKNIYEQIQGKILSQKVDLEKCVQYNTAMTESVPQPKNRDAFFDYFKENGVDRHIEKFVHVDWLRRLKRKIIAAKFRGGNIK